VVHSIAKSPNLLIGTRVLLLVFTQVTPRKPSSPVEELVRRKADALEAQRAAAGLVAPPSPPPPTVGYISGS
jgi:hypothetical protein